MGEDIVNPRQSARAAVRCEVRVAAPEGGYWVSPTRDFGPRGCQLLAPGELTPGTRVFLQLWNERLEGSVGLAGRVAWTERSAPWRTGVAFDDGSVDLARGFFDRLTAAFPGVDTYGRSPDRLDETTPIAPAAPPEGFSPALTEAEATLLAVVGEGAPAGAIRDRLGEGWPRGGLSALFALLGRHLLVVGAPDPEAASAWEALLDARR